MFRVETAGRMGFYPAGVASATASASAAGFPAGNLVDGDYLSYWDSNGTVPVSITLDLGRPRTVAYLAVNQREWSPTYNRQTFGRAEDSARIKDYTVSVANDDLEWSPVVSATMPSARGVQFIDLHLRRPAQFIRLDVASTWAAATVPRFYQKLQIDEMWVGYGHATPANPGSVTSYEAEAGTARGATGGRAG